MYESLFVCVYVYLDNVIEGVGFFGVGFGDSCELFCVGFENWILCFVRVRFGNYWVIFSVSVVSFYVLFDYLVVFIFLDLGSRENLI